jgi:hypothetical protein
MEEVARDWQDRKTGPGHKFKDLSCNTQHTSAKNAHTKYDHSNCHTNGLVTTNLVARSANTDTISGLLYQDWDAKKIQVCKCDVGFDGPDCGQRMVPKGDDPLTPVQSVGMQQGIAITGDAAGEFVLTYHDPYGGKWVTDAIKGAAGTSADDAIVAVRVQNALRDLPNEVLKTVTVSATTATSVSFCTRFEDGVQHFLALPNHSPNWRGKKTTNQPNNCEDEYTNTAMWDATDTKIDLTVQFGTAMGESGVQFLLEVDTSARGPGSFPVSKGMASVTQLSVAEINYNDNLANLSELVDCSDRGMDNGEGECECFEGFKGGACNMLEATM